VYQLVLEVAQENIDHALAVLGGMPKSDDPVWVAVARLNRTGRDTADAPSADPTPEAEGQGRDKPRRPFHELPPSTQAVLACQDERFIRWCARGSDRGNEQLVTEWVRMYCGVKSRSELNTNSNAAERWAILYARYRRETGLEAEPR
jgi:hypothetical protein